MKNQKEKKNLLLTVLWGDDKSAGNTRALLDISSLEIGMSTSVISTPAESAISMNLSLCNRERLLEVDIPLAVGISMVCFFFSS